MRPKGLSPFFRLLLEAGVLLIGGTVLAMGLFYVAGFRGMDHNHNTTKEAEAAAGWVNAADSHGDLSHSMGIMEEAKKGDSGSEEVAIGKPKEVRGMTIAANYSELTSEIAGIHLEAHITASRGNAAGFNAGEFIAGLAVKYKLKKLATGQELEGYLPEASDEPNDQHYHNDTKVPGAGEYELTLTVGSSVVGSSEIGGAKSRFWEKPAIASWKFTYAPGKR
ncbi:MAG: iron transporter [Chloroflexi bacterium]|nr:iron transporter [Chloroflexota bacterium]